MNARFRFSAKACLLSAMSGLFVGPGEISAQTSSAPTINPKPVPTATDEAGNARSPAVRDRSQAAPKSEVEQQLEAIYLRNGGVMPAMKPVPVLAPPVKIVPAATPKAAKKASTQPTTKPQKLPMTLVQQADVGTGSDKPVTQQVAGDRRAVYPQPGQPASDGSSTAVQQKLQELYQRDGRTMPPMDVSAFQMAPGGGAAPVQTGPGMPRVVPAKRNVFQRLFGIHKPSQRQAPGYARPNPMPAGQSPYVAHSQPPLVPPATLPVQPVQPTPVPGVVATPPAVAQQQPQAEPALLDEGTGAETGIMDDLQGEELAAKKPAAAPQPEASPYSGLKLVSPDSEPAIAQQDKDLKVGDAIAAGEPRTVSEIPAAPDDSTSRQLQLLAAHSDQKWLKGFCVVTLKNDRQLVEAQETQQTVYQGKTYTFASPEAKAEFDSNPDRYAPANNGNDVVKIAEGEPDIEGSLAHAAWYKGRLYLFSAAESREKFIATPKQYAIQK